MEFDLVFYLTKQKAFSYKTFGPDSRTAGILEHLGKELKEVEQAPDNLSEWVDVLILAFDGALRRGFTPQEIIIALEKKQEVNEGRKWPDWRTVPENRAIQHIKK